MSEVWCCKTHGTKLVVDGNNREFSTPPGSLFGFPQCMLILLGGGAGGGMPLYGLLAEGAFGNPASPCQIVKESG